MDLRTHPRPPDNGPRQQLGSAPRPAWWQPLLRKLEAFELMATSWLPPWRSGMPGILKFHMLFGFGWGLRSLWAAASGSDLLARQGDLDGFLTNPAGRAFLALGGALAVTQAFLILRPCPLGLYMFWAFHGWYASVAAVMTHSLVAVSGVLLWWTVPMALYGWYRRPWFHPRPLHTRAAESTAPTAGNVHGTPD